MNLNVPTLPLSIPIQVPMGGLLMMSMTSPLCNTDSVVSSSSSPPVAGGTGLMTDRYLQLEGVGVVRTGGEVSVHQGAATEGSAVGQLVLLAVLGLHALSVAVGGVSGAHRLPTYTNHTKANDSQQNHTTAWENDLATPYKV